MRREAQAIAILCGDIHLSHVAPACRAERTTKEWYNVQATYLEQLTSRVGDLPVVCSGDVFDKWDSPAELINFAIGHLPKGMYAVPGQHDLPNHSYKDIDRSAYWTLVQSGTVENLPPDCPLPISPGLCLHGFPWGWDIESCDKRRHDYEPEGQLLKGIQLAVIHKYVWRKTCSYPNAPESAHFANFDDSLRGYDAALFGDNHIQFLISNNAVGTTIFNNGTFLRRKSDERKYRPTIGVLYSDGRVEREFLDTKDDKFIDVDDLKFDGTGLDAEELFEVLHGLTDKVLDYKAAVIQYLKTHEVGRGVQKLVVKLLEGE